MHYKVGCQYKNINFTFSIYKIYKLCSILHEKHDRQFKKMVDSRELNFSRARVLFKGRVSSARQDLNSQGLVDPSSSTKMAENLFSLRLFYTKPVTQYFGTLWKNCQKIRMYLESLHHFMISWEQHYNNVSQKALFFKYFWPNYQYFHIHH